MTDADAFIDTIWAKPDDVLPRLVFADWLEEQGEVEYATFIRLSCEIERRAPTAPDERRRMRQERFHLQQRLAERWAGLIPGIDPHSVVSMYGMPDQYLTLYASGFLSWSGPTPAFMPSRLALRDCLGHETALANHPRLPEITHIRFAVGYYDAPPASSPPYPPVSDVLLRTLAESPNLRSLQSLDIRDIYPSRRGLAEFADSALASGLRRFAFEFPIDPVYHQSVDLDAIQPPAGAIREAIHRFLNEYGDLLPEN
jgi:uncharacterized protein (TIGR02996 family)